MLKIEFVIMQFILDSYFRVEFKKEQWIKKVIQLIYIIFFKGFWVIDLSYNPQIIIFIYVKAGSLIGLYLTWRPVQHMQQIKNKKRGKDKKVIFLPLINRNIISWFEYCYIVQCQTHFMLFQSSQAHLSQ